MHQGFQFETNSNFGLTCTTETQHVYNFETKQSDNYSNGACDALKPTLITHTKHRLIAIDVCDEACMHACITLIQIK